LARGPSKIATKPKGAGRLNHHQRIAWLRLIRSENVGPATFRALVNEFGGAEAAIDALPLFFPARTDAPTSAFAPRPKLRPSSRRRIASEQASLPSASLDIRPRSPRWMRRRRCFTPKASSSSPIFPSSPLSAPATARRSGKKFTRQIATELALEGFVIASGLARGIDTASHMAALEHGTVAVLAGGIDIVYPPENAELQHAIGERGLLISEPSRLLATRQGFPAAQPADLGDLARRGGDRGRRALRLADHRPLRRRTGTRGLRRSRQPARSALGGDQ